MTALGKHGRMQVAVAVSVMFHVIVILGVSFKLPDLSKSMNQPLEVTLVNAKSQARPTKADALAQANLDGGGNTDARRRARSPLPVPREARREADLAMAQKRVEQLERESKQLLTQARSKTAVAAAPEAPQPKEEARAAPNTADIMSRSLEIARLEASIAREWESYQQRPRRRFIGARTQEFRFARYVEDWRVKIERIGELNYPQAARDQRLYGSLVVTVSIKSDGSLERVDINRSSRSRILDAAALRIVQLAAPYAPFAADIAKDTDIISITRTWIFTRSDQFVAE
ncbi:MAG: energy transducer TonB [Betaproteobacteria bacterium RIFCSPLOWO2_02_FULL_67_26]|nr:MAG: energy transducer TonB [Betaproteobacteria bacterium RIFCSPLOWO2_02_FULL_67_26]